MAQNLLNGELVLRAAWDPVAEALKMVPAASTEFEIALDAADGDTVATQGQQKNAAKVSITTVETGVVVPALDVSGIKSFQIYVKTTSAITTPQILTLSLSPHATDDVWFVTTCTVTPSASNGVVAASSLFSGVALRARVSIAAALDTGSADIYLVTQGN